MGTGGGAAAVAAAVAAQKKRQRQQEEEERLTTYRPDDLEGWEFKIVRSSTGAFKKREVVEQLRREESQAGWEMVEKFDDSRIRFKRRTDRRANDQHLATDPYRTNYGMSEGKLAAIIVISVLGIIGLVIAVGIILAQ